MTYFSCQQEGKSRRQKKRIIMKKKELKSGVEALPCPGSIERERER